MRETRQYWLMKSEPETYSIDALQSDHTSAWEGVRNYQARNFMRDSMRMGDLILFYHSNAQPPGIAGIARVSKESHPDSSALDAESLYYDPKATLSKPRWFMIDVTFVEKLPRFITLQDLKSEPGLKNMLVLRRGMRLSIQPVTQNQFDIIRKLGGCTV